MRSSPGHIASTSLSAKSWSSPANVRHKEVLSHDGPLILPSTDLRSEQIARIATRLVTALEEQDDHVVCGAAWPPREDIMDEIYDHEDRMTRRRSRAIEYKPSATAHSNFVPFRPLSSNPLKGQNIKAADWNIYIVDLVRPARFFEWSS